MIVGRVAGDDEHVALEALEAAARRRGRVAGAPRLLLDGDRSPSNASRASGEVTTTSGFGPSAAHRLDHPVGEPPAEQRMQVLRGLRAHARAEAGGQDDRCERGLGHG